jgi:hypothetical protein
MSKTKSKRNAVMTLDWAAGKPTANGGRTWPVVCPSCGKKSLWKFSREEIQRVLGRRPAPKS